MIFPVRMQVAAQHRLKQSSIFAKLLVIRLQLRMPFGLKPPATIDRLAEMCQRFFRHIELLVFRPTQVALGFPHCVFTWSIAVCFASSLGWHSESDYCFD